MHLWRGGKTAAVSYASNWFASSTSATTELSCAALKHTWPNDELIQLMNLTRKPWLLFLIHFFILCLFSRIRGSKAVGARMNVWNSSASFSSKIVTSAHKIFSKGTLDLREANQIFQVFIKKENYESAVIWPVDFDEETILENYCSLPVLTHGFSSVTNTHTVLIQLLMELLCGPDHWNYLH